MPDERQRIADNVAQVRQRISQAAERSGRTRDDVLLVAVTKYVGVDSARSLVDAGCQALGESRPQELWTKAEAMNDPAVQWHLIGHLQRNKIRRTLPWLSWLHSVDSRRLLDALERETATGKQRLRVLLEVNVSGDVDKTGFSIDEALRIAEQLGCWSHLEIGGLMAMSALESDSEAARRDFARLRELRDAMQRQCPPGIGLRQLSMGMSRDYEVAIEEGATMVRVGSALLEGVMA
jgi:pyridoxal phosphate enzyme (YggS family)